RTGHRRRIFVEPRGEGVASALQETVAAWQAQLPGLAAVPAGPDAFEVTAPPALDGGHETHFAKVLDRVLTLLDDGRPPATPAARACRPHAGQLPAARRGRREDEHLTHSSSVPPPPVLMGQRSNIHPPPGVLDGRGGRRRCTPERAGTCA